MLDRVTSRALFSRQPLAVLGKTTVVALLGTTVLWGALSALVGNFTIFVIASSAFLMAILVETGIRWMPLAGGLLCGYLAYTLLFVESFPIFHLEHPKDALGNTAISFVTFLMIVLMIWWAVVGLGAGLTAFVQNYQSQDAQAARRSTPRWYRPVSAGLCGVLVGVILLGIAQPATTTVAATTGGAPTVHMEISNFSQPSISISKGSKLQLVDDGTFHHNLANGSWVNGQPQIEQPSGAPVVNNMDINASGKSIELGPFNTVGIYHVYCTLHQGMTLTVTVQ